ncbi:MAG TPA: 3-deoxy-manno-octulosonate cytidylyltransferase [Bacteroidales bacterium]|nr:3-deoxy-manno-octulosonate cytidylyltransferase [Bacteroidales bacterium]
MNRPLNFAGIIPARYASSRFPGKPLALIGNKPMVRLVYEQASKALDNVFVATDDERIYNAVAGFNGRVVMTSPDHRSGTDRCAEAAAKLNYKGVKADIIINIQGDEPFIKPEQIKLLKECFTDESVQIATLVRIVKPDEDLSDINHPKVVLDKMGNAVYFSRSVIPFFRGDNFKSWSLRHNYFKHIGLYAYRLSVLEEITKLPQSSLEIAESLEQNRWIENGYKIRTAVSEWESIGIDTPEDLEKARNLIGGM